MKIKQSFKKSSQKKMIKYGEWIRAVLFLSHEAVGLSQSRGAESAHKDTPPQCGKTGIGALAQSAKCATVPIRNLRQDKTLITSACLKHTDFLKIDNKIEMRLTVFHMKPFSMKERVRRLGSTKSCRLADTK